jgi:putative photosynthetic complex assembly protein
MSIPFDTTQGTGRADHDARRQHGDKPPRRRERGRGREAHHHAHEADVKAVRFAFGLAFFAVVAVALLQWFGSPAKPESLTPVVQERKFSVEDFPGGIVELRDAESRELIARYDIGEGAFVRTSLRSLADARHRIAPGDQSPFRLELRESGRLRLIDPVTEQVLELWAFGHDNALAYEVLLPGKTDSQRAVAGAPAVAQKATRSNPNER